jgi:CubicO group peptidase (beta-lactamase class C family)
MAARRISSFLYLLTWIFVLAFVLPVGISAADPNAGLIGHWEGAIQLPGTSLAISIDFSAKQGGGLNGFVSIPAQGARDLPVANIVMSGSEAAFDLGGVPGDPKFKGQLAENGTKISGNFTQGGQTFPFALERKANPSEVAKEVLTGFDLVATDAMKRLDVPGMAIAVVQGKDVIYSRGFGFRDVEKQLAVTPETLFAIGSSTKAFTAFVLGTLVDEGKVEWDKPVRNYIPWFRLYDQSASERLTPRDLVTHRSGLPRHDLTWYNNFEASRKSLVQELAYLEPSADLRAKFQYNNLMFLTAGYLEEVVTGKTWEEAVRERILSPLGMKRTNFSVADSQKDSNFGQPYEKKDDKIMKMPFRPITNMGPAGSINSSVDEMSRWLIVHLNGGKFGDRQLASPATVDEMHLAQMTTGGTVERPEISPADYAMGWFVDTYRGHRRVQHGGNIDGFSANVVLFPQDQLGIVVLTNLNGTPLIELIARTIVDRLLKLSPIDWVGEAAAKRAKGEAAAKEAKKKKEVTRVAGTQPAHKLPEYAGEYEHPGYGVLKVELKDDRLETLYNGISTPLGHWHYETFTGMKAKDDTFEDMKYTFQTDVDGFVAAVIAPFEPAVKDIVFTKKPDARLFETEYLKRFLGKYELATQVVTIGLKGNSLTVLVPGQPLYELAPGLGDQFTLKEARVIHLRFVVDEKGSVTAVEFRQPNGVFIANRKE